MNRVIPSDFAQLMAGSLTVGIWIATIYRFMAFGHVEQELLSIAMLVIGWWLPSPKIAEK